MLKTGSLELCIKDRSHRNFQEVLAKCLMLLLLRLTPLPAMKRQVSIRWHIV